MGLHLIRKPDKNTSVSPYDKVSEDTRRRSIEPEATNWIDDIHNTTKALEKRLNLIEAEKQSSEMSRLDSYVYLQMRCHDFC